MKFSISSGLLLKHLDLASKIIDSSSSTIPVLSNILFEIEGNKLSLTAANMNTRISTKFELVEADADISFMAPYDILLGALKELPDQPIEIKVDLENEGHATILYSNGHFDFLAKDSSTFPEPLIVSKEKELLTLPSDDFLSGLNATIFAASTDERRPIMTGVLLDMLEDKMVYVASDGKILMRYTDPRVKSKQESQITLPGKLCQYLTKSLLPKLDGDIKLYVDNKHLLIELGDSVLTARLLDGMYPKYNSVIPTNTPFKVDVEKSALLSAAKQAAIAANKGSKLIVLEISADNIKITANDLELSVSGEANVPCTREEADGNIRIGFKFEMLQAILQAIDSEEVRLSLIDQTRAAIITPYGTEEPVETLGLITPLRLIGE